jgi:hypothetical protein
MKGGSVHADSKIVLLVSAFSVYVRSCPFVSFFTVAFARFVFRGWQCLLSFSVC